MSLAAIWVCIFAGAQPHPNAWALKASSSPATVDFGTDCTTHSRTREVRLRNDSAAPIALGALQSSGGYSVVGSGVVAPGATTLVRITAAPGAEAAGTISVPVRFEPAAVQASISKLRAENTAALGRMQKSLADMKSQGPDYSPIEAAKASAEKAWRTKRSELEARESDEHQKLLELLAEKEQVLREMRAGLYCSKCMRSKTQIEKETHKPFQAHLDDVKGVPVPAPPELMKQKEAEYEQKIADAAAREKAAGQKIEQEKIQFRRKLDDIDKKKIALETQHAGALVELEKRVRERAAEDAKKVLAVQQRLSGALQTVRVSIVDPCSGIRGGPIALGEHRDRPDHDALGYRAQDRFDLLKQLAGSNAAELDRAVEKYLVDQTGSLNGVLFGDQNMPAGGLRGSMRGSWDVAERMLPRVEALQPMIMKLAGETGIPPALGAAVSSRESRLGAALDAKGYGDHGKAYGHMQLDLKKFGKDVSQTVAPGGEEHYRQAFQYLRELYERVSTRHSDWSESEKWRAAAGAYNFGAGNVRTKSGIDRGSTGNDYSGDVWAQAQWFALSGLFEEPPVQKEILP